MKSSLHCYTVPSSQPFIKVLAEWVLSRYGENQRLFTQTLVLLPNRRACRSLRDAFLDRTGGKPMLLPRIQPIGDMDDDFPAIYAPEGMLSAMPAISPVRRQFLLARLVRRYKQLGLGRGLSIEQSLELARQLARLVDETAREGLSMNRLDALVPEDLAAHWQDTLRFLDIIAAHWPGLLREEGMTDPVTHHNQLLRATAQGWREQPPSYPIIAAGTTGCIPATAALLAAIASLPHGMVVLPGLDTAMPEKEWDMIGETHPQSGLKQLLNAIGAQRQEVWPLDAAASSQSPRTACLHAILQPPEATAHWTAANLPLSEGMRGITLLTADTQAVEARMIAVALRETLETPGKTAALVTPDRSLARMVAAQMRRFDIAIDDSGGTALLDTPPGAYLRLTLDMVASGAAPVPLLSLLRHPMTAIGLETAECRRLSRLLEKDVLRGVRYAPGLRSLCDATASYPEVQAMLLRLDEACSPLMSYFERKEPAPLRLLMEAHVALAEILASTPSEPGHERLWAGEAGNALSAALMDIVPHSGILDDIDPHSYPGLFTVLLAGETYRPRFGLHPRLHILSPMEARLQHYDRMILAGMNEGCWPAAPEADPWMSRPMRTAFGLSPPERMIGQAAHDIVMFAGASEVYFTRARKVEGAPTVPSRWLVRLKTLVEGENKTFYASLHQESQYMAALEQLDAPHPLPKLERPKPKPPLAARPARMRVTDIDVWLRDPYVIYAKYVLRLRALDALDKEPDNRDFGTLVHAALERFVRRWPQALPERPLEALLACGREAFAASLDRPAVASLWWPRFESMAEWFVTQEKAVRPAMERTLAEIKGTLPLNVDGHTFVLTTTIDRIDVMRDGGLTISDYKTGDPPSQKDVQDGNANQLPLEALIVRHGRLNSPVDSAAPLRAFAYWRLSGDAEKSKVTEIVANTKTSPEALMHQAEERVRFLIRQYRQPESAYAPPLDPSLSPPNSDYAHLERRQEWEEA